MRKAPNSRTPTFAFRAGARRSVDRWDCNLFEFWNHGIDVKKCKMNAPRSEFMLALRPFRSRLVRPSNRIGIVDRAGEVTANGEYRS